MIQRDPLVSGGVTEPANGPIGGPEATLRPNGLFSRDTWVARFWNQLVAPSTQDKKNDGSSGAGHARLQEILAGDCEHLEPIDVPTPNYFDQELDAGQREAVARVLGTPDVCLIEGLPGTGKSRVVAEVVLQAAQRGERILLLASSAPGIDHILDTVGNHELVCPIRCVGAAEKAAHRFSFQERLRDLYDRPLERARVELATADTASRGYTEAEPLFARLQDMVARSVELGRLRTAFQQQQGRLPGEVNREATAAESGAASSSDFSRAVSRIWAIRNEVVGKLDSNLTTERGEADRLRHQLAELNPRLHQARRLVDSKRHGRWWTGDFWRATFRSNTCVAELESLQVDVTKLQSELDTCNEEIQRLEQERQKAQQDYQTQRGQLVDQEIARRRALLEEQEAGHRTEVEQFNTQWRSVCLDLGRAGIEVGDPSADAVTTARQQWEQARQGEAERHENIRGWIKVLERQAGALPARLMECTNLVAATAESLAGDRYFGKDSKVRFDLAVVQEAEALTQPQVVAIAQRARRCVLISEPMLGSPGDGHFQSLWRSLNRRGRSCTWLREKGRLCCRLRNVTAEQRQYLEREPVADRPDVELRILTLPGTQPTLAEITFPPAMTIVEAKEFVFRELEEAAVQVPSTAPLSWTENPGAIALHLAGPADGPTITARLDNGVREVLQRCDKDAEIPPTLRLEFDPQAGWNATRAREWVRRHLGFRDLGRTARLNVPHGAQAGLADFVADLVLVEYEGRSGKSGGAVEFVRIEKPAATNGGNGRHARRGPQPQKVTTREGAGFEVDLADAKHHNRLPPELRAELPKQGFANLVEAQAVVAALQSLAARQPASSIAVVALYLGQAELIRRLADKASLPKSIEIMTPATFRHRQSDVVLVSLTRSHVHRAVSYGEAPEALATALTRARTKLILFGDPGTLARRTQWNGAVDHLNEAAALRERDLIARLVTYLDGQGRHQAVFQVRAGEAS
jgi:predicted nuclease with TOPRIM domain